MFPLRQLHQKGVHQLNSVQDSSRKKPRTLSSEPKQKKEVRFSIEHLETIHEVESFYESSSGNVTTDDNQAASILVPTSQLTEEIKLLSTEHGRARRHLREIPKHSLQACVKYGIKTKGNPDPKTKLPRWKYTHGNVVYITDHTSEKEITCYKEAVTIAPAPISKEMLNRHHRVKRIIDEEPHMCTSHFVVVVDQSGSMKKADVNGFRNRSQAAFGCLALDCIAEQLTVADATMVAGIDTFTLIEMNDEASIVFQREPLDWILFNKILNRQKETKPKSHGNYGPSIVSARKVIEQELDRLDGIDKEDLPGFALILLSDGKPSDMLDLARAERLVNVMSICERLKEKFSLFTMGLGADGSDFAELEILSTTANTSGSNGTFNHAGLSAAKIGNSFSEIASSMSTVRSGLLSKITEEVQKDDEAKPVIPLKKRRSLKKTLTIDWQTVTKDVERYKLDLDLWENISNKRTGYNHEAWKQIDFSADFKKKKKTRTVGFKFDKIAFGKGTERFAHRFIEIDANGKHVGKLHVAKETKGVREETKKFAFHENFCRIQITAKRLAKQFNTDVHKTPSLRPLDDSDQGPPKIKFAKCSVYQYTNDSEETAGMLVENFLKGKFIKYNTNNGYVNEDVGKKSPTIILCGGEVPLTDFLQAFSHWTYVHTEHKLLLCDLQGVLDQEGRTPRFNLTDPAVCSNKRVSKIRRPYGRTDLGLKGIRSFTKHHKCNIVCKCLGLPEL